MKSTLKKVICIVLCLSMLMIFPVTAAAASAPTLVTSQGANPVVVINGWQNNPLFINPESSRVEQVFPPARRKTSLRLSPLRQSLLPTMRRRTLRTGVSDFPGKPRELSREDSNW